MTDIQQAQAPVAPENFPLAIVAGIATALVGAGLWATVTVVTQRELGVMAIAVGYIVGYAIKAVGHGHSPKFGVAGAVCALSGCVLGNLASALIFFADQSHVSVMTVLSNASPTFLVSLMKEFAQALDFLFYAIAIYEGYRFSFRT
ncbi:MAG: hypothetical protein ACREHE_10250 [Rhizomicrobium sp.]